MPAQCPHVIDRRSKSQVIATVHACKYPGTCTHAVYISGRIGLYPAPCTIQGQVLFNTCLFKPWALNKAGFDLRSGSI